MFDEHPRFGWTFLYVDDIDAALNFYRSACNLTVRYRHETGEYAELEALQTTRGHRDRNAPTVPA